MTYLQDVYDRFFSKIDEDMTGKEVVIYNIFISAKSKSYKTTRNDLDYTLTDEEEYDGVFDDVLDDDEIELLALWMVYEWNRRKQQKLIGLQRDIGTKDFSKLPNKESELRGINETMKLTLSDIDYLRNEFNLYEG